MNDTTTQRIEVPGYRLVHPIGTSGVATVYLAVQLAIESQVVVKVFDTTDEAAVARFEQSLRTNARLAHPNIVAVQQIGHTPDGHLFHSTPLLLSSELAAPTLRNKPLTVAALLRGVLEALAHAHQRGITHGGIQPSNVLIDEHGYALLADFGIARCASELELPHSETPGYPSPEQVRGKPAGRRSDLYSTGVLAYRLLVGSLPFASSLASITASGRKRHLVPRLPPALRAWQGWIDRALAEAPEQRFQSAQEMADALSVIDGQHAGRNAPPSDAGRRVSGWMIGSLMALLIAAVVVAGWAIWTRRHPATLPRPGNATALAPTDAVVPDVESQAQPATPETAGGVAGATERTLQAMVTQADGLRAHGHLFTPRRNNAVQQYLAILVLDPGNRSAHIGIDVALASVRRRLQNAWHGDQAAPAVALLNQGDELAAHAGSRARRDWDAERSALAEHVGNDIADAARRHAPQRIAALKPLAVALPATYPAGFDLDTAEQLASAPYAGMRMRDPGGPGLVYVPAAGGAPGFGIARVEATVTDYAAFVRATHRPASTCVEAYNPFSRLRDLTWKSPGFAQGGDYPVVCVSWSDAAAYVAWLSRITGEPYRLPSSGEWLHAARGVPKGTPCELGNVDDVSRKSFMDNDRWSCDDGYAQTAPVGHFAPSAVGAYDLYGNVSEWLAGGSAHTREFRGLSWRDGSHGTPLGRKGGADSDTGYTNVGFRVVRVIDAAHPAPPAVRSP